MLGGYDLNALPLVAEVLGIEDIEALIGQLMIIRDWERKRGSRK